MTRDVHSIEPSYLNIAAFTARTQALGPGTRAVIWVQGCPFNCPGCIAPDWIPIRPAKMLTAEDLLKKIDLAKIDGITFSGGEPMLQASSLARLAKLAKEEKDLNIICFTGYQFERLLSSPPNAGVSDLLNEIDVLIDGPYVQSKNDSIGLRGSSNQRIIHLTSKLESYDLNTQKRSVEVRILNGELSFIGIPTKAIKAAVDEVVLR